MKYVYIYLQINGVNLEKVTHNEAVECFVRAKETVCLKVQKGAHAEIMVSAYTVDVLKFQTLVSFQIGLPNQCRPRSDFLWSGSSMFAILTSILLIPALI